MSIKFYIGYSFRLDNSRRYIGRLWLFLPCADGSTNLASYFINEDAELLTERLTPLWGSYKGSGALPLPSGADQLSGYRFKAISLAPTALISETQQALFDHGLIVRDQVVSLAKDYKNKASALPEDTLLEFSIDE